MNTPSVSVCIPTYNRASMVRQAIDAALSQRLPPTEVIVTDDASTDGTWSMLTGYAAREPRLKILRHEKNTGGVENWNSAIRQTTSPYIAWCSDDDRFLPDHLAASVAYLEAHPSIGLVHSGFLDAVESETASQVFERPLRFTGHTGLDRGGLLTYLTRYYDWPFHPSTIVMRREVWNRVGPFNPQFALADTDWFVRVVESFPIAMLATRGVLNRRHPGNWSNRLGSAAMQREILGIVEGSINRLFPREPVARAIWKCIWRNNVRARLLLTLRARAASGHTGAACAAWTQLIDGTRLPLPHALRNVGETLIRAYSSRKNPVFNDARQSVTPL